MTAARFVIGRAFEVDPPRPLEQLLRVSFTVLSTGIETRSVRRGEITQ